MTALQIPKLNVTKKRKAEELDAENIDPQSDAKIAIKKLKKSNSMKELPLQESTAASRESGDEDELKAKLSSVKSKFKRLKAKYDELVEEKKRAGETQAREIESATSGNVLLQRRSAWDSCARRLQEEDQAVGAED